MRIKAIDSEEVDIKQCLSSKVKLPQYYDNMNNGFDKLEWRKKIESVQHLVDIGIELKEHQ